uniref:Uncharacterized protein n=1 Tax=Arundo donax TaxID=35708 RepID=A0A0A9B9Z4_ARUDO
MHRHHLHQIPKPQALSSQSPSMLISLHSKPNLTS